MASQQVTQWVEQWVATRDAVLRGLTHALSNRAGTLGAVASMLAPGSAPPPAVLDVVRDETERLDELLALFRLLPLEADATPEPLHLPDLVAPVTALLAHHPDLRTLVDERPGALLASDVAERAADVPPVLAPHSRLLHALVALLAAAAQAPNGVRLAWRAADDRVFVIVGGAERAIGVATWLLGGGHPVRAGDGGSAVIELTTLAAARGGERPRNTS